MPSKVPSGKRPVQIDLPLDLVRAIKVHAAQTDTTMQDIVEVAVRKHLKAAQHG